MVGASGTKMYIHDFKDRMSYILMDNMLWNMRTDVLICGSGRRVKLFYSVFDDEKYEDVIMQCWIDRQLLAQFK
jgi:hypothetical protein